MISGTPGVRRLPRLIATSDPNAVFAANPSFPSAPPIVRGAGARRGQPFQRLRTPRPGATAEPIARSTQATDPAPSPPVATLPGKQATRRGCYVFYHDFDLNPNDPIFASLETLPDQVYGELKLPPTNTVIQVFLFETQERRRYMFAPKTGRYRHLPSRRAYFITEPRVGGGADELKVFTWMGDHLKDRPSPRTHACALERGAQGRSALAR